MIHPHLPIRIPCYDLVPIAESAVVLRLQRLAKSASGIPDFRDLTGGVYKTRERIQRGMADPRLLAIPAS